MQRSDSAQILAKVFTAKIGLIPFEVTLPRIIPSTPSITWHETSEASDLQGLTESSIESKI